MKRMDTKRIFPLLLSVFWMIAAAYVSGYQPEVDAMHLPEVVVEAQSDVVEFDSEYLGFHTQHSHELEAEACDWPSAAVPGDLTGVCEAYLKWWTEKHTASSFYKTISYQYFISALPKLS